MSESPNWKTTSEIPDLSVILVVGGQRERAAAALHSLLGQSIGDRLEILLFDLGPENCEPLKGSDHPRVRMVRCGQESTLARSRVQGIHAARAPIVAFMEEHCQVQPGWAEAMVLAHRGPWWGVGCDFINGNPEAGRSDQAFRMNYGLYVQPHGGRGPVRRIPGQNSAFKRDVLLRYDEKELEWMTNADLVMQWKMGQKGSQLFYEPAAKMAHLNENTLRSLCVGAFYWNWCFSHVRAEVFHWSFFRRVIQILLSPLIPWVRLARAFILTLRLGRTEFLQFIGDIPYTLAANYCSAAGQVVGLLNPLEKGARKFSHFEMNEPRLLRTELIR